MYFISIFLSKNNICMCGSICGCVHVRAVSVEDRIIRSPGTRVRDGCEPLWMLRIKPMSFPQKNNTRSKPLNCLSRLKSTRYTIPFCCWDTCNTSASILKLSVKDASHYHSTINIKSVVSSGKEWEWKAMRFFMLQCDAYLLNITRTRGLLSDQYVLSFYLMIPTMPCHMFFAWLIWGYSWRQLSAQTFLELLAEARIKLLSFWTGP